MQVGEKALASQLLLDGEALDAAPPLTLMLHKPVGYVVTSPEDEMVTDLKVYDLLPYRCVDAGSAVGLGASICARMCVTRGFLGDASMVLAVVWWWQYARQCMPA